MGTTNNGCDGEKIQFRSEFNLFHIPRSSIKAISYGCRTNVLDKQTEKCEHPSPPETNNDDEFKRAQMNVPKRNLNCLKQSVIATHAACFKVVPFITACQRFDPDEVPHEVKALYKICFTEIGQSNCMNHLDVQMLLMSVMFMSEPKRKL